MKKTFDIMNNLRKYDELDQPDPVFEPDFSSMIIIDGLPPATGEKGKKLELILKKKILSPFGEIISFHLGTEFAFVEFKEESSAKEAVNRLNGKNLDKDHKIKVNLWSDFERVQNIPEKFTPPKFETYQAKGNLKLWLLDPRGYDQFALRYSDITEICWNDLKHEKDPERVEKREGWASLNVLWSPQGTYFTVFDQKGAYTYGGPNFDLLMKFPHQNVRFLDISPCERYLITGVPSEISEPKSQDIIVWDIRTGKKIRGFFWYLDPKKSNFVQWPVFKWTKDGNYLCRAGSDHIAIYETPSMVLLDKEPIKVPNLSFGEKDDPHFSVCPGKEPIIAYCVKAVEEKPSCVTLLNFKTKEIIAQKNLFNVQEPRMFWQSEGDYLLVKVEQLQPKNKKFLGSALEIFRLREPNVPVEQFVLGKEEKVKYITWEPKGHRLALVVVTTSPSRPNICFLSVKQEGKKKNTIQLLKTLHTKAANHLSWSPKGTFIVFAGLSVGEVPLAGVLEFYNVDDFETISLKEHMGAGTVEWDPSGRYVTTVASMWRGQSETGYNIYSFAGRHLAHIYKEKFCQFLWRPRPPSLLSDEQKKKILQDEKKYKDLIRKELYQEREVELEEIRKKKASMKEEFLKYLEYQRERYEAQKEEREKILKNTTIQYIETEQLIEEFVSKTETILN